jgi:molybdopterin molybdotransferase
VRSVEEQQARVSAAAVAPRPVRVAIAEAQGLMCAEEVVTERPLPGFDQAAIDGYAVRSVDVLGVGEPEASDEHVDDDPQTLSPVPGEPGESAASGGGVTLPVLGSIDAGTRTPSRLQPGQAARVQTGAPMPTLADAVLPLRWTDGGQSRVRVLRGVRSGAYVRRAGDDVQPGDVAVRAGTIVGAAQVGLLAAVGRDRVLVHPRPRLSVLAVGGELVDVSRTPGNGQVYDVNSYALAAAGRDAGAEVNRVGIVSNDPKELGEVVEGQISRAEIVVIAGAVGGTARWKSPGSRCTRARSRASGSWAVTVCRRFCCRRTRSARWWSSR